MIVLVLAACGTAPREVSTSRAVTMSAQLPPMRGFAAAAQPRPTRPNAEIAQDFLDLSFVLESGRVLPVLTRFEGPVSVRVAGRVPPSLMPDLRALMTRLQREAGIDIALTDAAQANITIEAVPRARMQRTVPGAACFVVPRVTSWAEFTRARRSPVLDWTTLPRRDTVAVFVPSDVAPQEIRDCLHEELAQALGPLNDLYSVPDSVFNDDNIHAVLTGFDMLILRATYDPVLQSGMTRAAVAARLPGILARLNPAGERAAAPRRNERRNDTPPEWTAAITAALTGTLAPARRAAAAERAVIIARAQGWTGPRAGFADYAYGRLQLGQNPARALAAFRQAARVYRAAPDMRIHEAHVAVQLAAFALGAGDADTTLVIVDDAIPTAAAHENAALLATLMMLRAEALDLAGRREDAAATRLDSLGWARYGFGSDNEVRERLRDVAALGPARQS